MNSSPPLNSKIKIGTLNGYEHIIIPHTSAGIIRFLIGGFLLFWLTAWYAGFSNALEEIMAGKGGLFLFVWITLWSFGGLYAIYFLYRILKKPVPEQLLFNKPNLSLDTGVSPFNMNFHNAQNMQKPWKQMFPKRRRLEFNPEELKSMQLRDTGSGNRLTIDKGLERIEIASHVTDIEKEWLFQYLQDSYSLAK